MKTNSKRNPIKTKRRLLILIFVTLLFFPNINFAQAPNLGAASGFALFTAVGAFTNVGATNITGNIGTNVGAFDFTGGTVNGNIYLPGSSVAAQAATDVDAAYSYMNGITCGTTIGTTLGSGQILTPDVYCLGGVPSTLTGNLILDAGGNPNALFIIKINGALTTSTFSNVVLINSASSSNVYWQINGAFELGDGSVFSGTVVANGAINLLNGSFLEGRGLSIAGAINTYAITATLPSSTLPIELLHFNVYDKHSYNLLSWSTATEINNNYFTLERTTDGENFTEVARITGAGTSSLTNDYSYKDYGFDKKQNYYRLKQTDYNGQSKTFDMITIDNAVTVYKIVKVIDILGKEVNAVYEGLRFVYYENGVIEGKVGK